MATKKEVEAARKRASETFDSLADGASTIPKTKLAAALKGVGFSNDDRMQCQALMVLDKNGDIAKDEFLNWCNTMVAEGNGAKLNRLLIRYVVGKSRDTSYDLPGLSFTYGNKPQRSEEPAGNIIFSWVAGEKSKKKKKGKDIIYENRMANINGCINTKQANEWRDAYRARKEAKEAKRREMLLKIEADESLGIAVKKEDKEAVQEGPKKPWEGDICFGSISIPSEAVGTLLVGVGNVKDSTYADLSGQTAAGRLPKPRSTNSADLLYKNSRRKPSSKEPFKMSKFKKIGSRYLN